jgi:hypothetical protein
MPLDDIVAEWRRRVDTAFVASLAGVIHDRQPVAASADRRLVDGEQRLLARRPVGRRSPAGLRGVASTLARLDAGRPWRRSARAPRC